MIKYTDGWLLGEARSDVTLNCDPLMQYTGVISKIRESKRNMSVVTKRY